MAILVNASRYQSHELFTPNGVVQMGYLLKSLFGAALANARSVPSMPNTSEV